MRKRAPMGRISNRWKPWIATVAITIGVGLVGPATADQKSKTNLKVAIFSHIAEVQTIHGMMQAAIDDAKARGWAVETFDGRGDMVAVNNQVSSFISLSVQLGGSIASTMLVTIFDRRTYFHSDTFRGSLTLANVAVQHYAKRPEAIEALARLLQQQAVNAGFADSIFALVPCACLAVGLAVGFLWAFLFNGILGARLGVFYYGRVIPGLALWEGSKHQYPLYDALAMGVMVMVFAYILGRTDPEGRTVIEAWAHTNSPSRLWSTVLSILGVVVVANLLYGAVFTPHLVTKLEGQVTAGPTTPLFPGVPNQPLQGATHLGP